MLIRAVGWHAQVLRRPAVGPSVALGVSEGSVSLTQRSWHASCCMSSAAHERDLTASISPSAWEVLYGLRARGHESYVVGGTVRDFLLGCKTKDVDVCTSATPEQVKSLFPRSKVLGRRFPIVHVRQNKDIIEVSSFRTNCDDTSAIPLDWYQQQQQLRAKHAGGRRRAGNGGSGRGSGFRESVLADWNEEESRDWASSRRQNAMKRDFTINGMLYEPFSRVLFDYVDGMQDCDRRVLRTIQPPDASFREDPARILRAVRLATRLGLEIDDDTKREVIAQKESVLDLSHGRLQMELGAMFAYGSAEATYNALVQFDMLRMLLPHHHRRRDLLPLGVLRLMDDSVQSLSQPLTSITYNGALFTMLVVAEMTRREGRTSRGLAGIDIVDEVFDLVTMPKQQPKQLLARKALEQTSFLLREQILLMEQGGSAGQRRRRKGKQARTATTGVLEGLIARALG